MDIAMTYENYVKFIEVCDKELDKSKYFLQRAENEPNYYLSFMKMRDITTTLIEEGNKDIDITYGVYIDIFPLVGVPKNKIKRKLLEINRAFALSANINVINNKILSFLFNKCILKIFGKKRILKICTRNCLKYSCNDYEDWCSIFDGDGMKVNMTTKNIMGNGTKRLEFEGLKLPVPDKCDEYLTHIYGDYLTPPTDAKKKAKEHTAYYLDLEHSYMNSNEKTK